MSSSRLAILLALFTAAAIFVAPSDAMPCISSCDRAADGEFRESAGCSECSGHGDTPVEQPQRSGDSPLDDHGVPCDCPHECPAPCSAGKLPCPPIEPILTAVDMAPAGVHTCQTGVPPHEVAPEGIFHPPRV